MYINQFSNFLLKGEINSFLKIGGNQLDVIDLDLIQDQDQDIPAIYQYDIEDSISFEITIFNKVIIGINFDLEYYTDLEFRIFEKKSFFSFSKKLDLNNFVHFLNDNNIIWRINKEIETHPHSLIISTEYNVNVLYSLNVDNIGFYRVFLYDNDLYKKLKILAPDGASM